MTNEELAVSYCNTLGRDMVNIIASARQEAALAERERCAKIVEGETGDTQYYPDEYGGERGETTYDMASLAAKIRKGGGA